ncbi:MAG TPA: hypothetical protein VFQ23_22655 [Anaerolineales bacterium]|nr:hypothetical protein [Anaerolineales bacterium]
MKNSIFALIGLLVLFVSACAPMLESTQEALSTQTPPVTTSTKPTGALLIWQSNDSPCKTAAFSTESLSYGECGKALTASTPETADYESRLLELSDSFASFTAETSVGSLILKGSGESVPTSVEKRAIAEWATWMFETSESGQADTSSSQAFVWQREGGIAGFCDNVSVHLTGLVTTSDCKGFHAEAYLTASQLEQLYGWVYNLGDIEYDDSNAPLADGMQITLSLDGTGQGEPDEQTIRDMIDFASTLDVQLGNAAEAGPEVSDAQNALGEYLLALHKGDYPRASELYSGDLSLLQTWNPDIPNAGSELFERACSQNGLQCLAPRSITYRSSEVDGHHFWVEFNNNDGTLFQQGPCCGETNGPLISRFPFYVEQRQSGFFVWDLPPYVP